MTAIIPAPEGYRPFVVRVDPRNHGIGDEGDWQTPDWSMWLVEEALEDRAIRALTTVRRSITQWTRSELRPLGYAKSAWELMADVHIRFALTHPRSPFGLAYRHQSQPREAMVIHRGDYFARDARGVLTPLPVERESSWPTPDQWCEAIQSARLRSDGSA